MSFVVLGVTCSVFLLLAAVLGCASCCCVRAGSPWKLPVTVGALCFCYYAVSISMSMIQKFLLTSFDHGWFRFPLTMTTVHVSIKAVMAATFLGMPCCRRGTSCTLGIPTRDYLLFVIPIGVATAADIALSNVALLTITLTMYTIGKTASILFNYSLSAMLRLQPARCSLSVAVLGIFGGMVLASYRATHFHLWGFIAVVFAAFTAATRWVLTERLFDKNDRRLASMELLYVLAPVSIPILVPFALVLEAEAVVASPIWSQPYEAAVGVAAVIVAGITSFLLILLELAIVNRTSALTTDVLGYVKSLTMIVLASVTYGDALSTINAVGVTLAFTSAFLYSYLKRRMAMPPPRRLPGVTDQQVAYDILSALEMAEAWSDDPDALDEDPVARSRVDSDGSGLGLTAHELALGGDEEPQEKAARKPGGSKRSQRRRASVASVDSLQ